MKSPIFMMGITLIAAPAWGSGGFQECQIETVTSCSAYGCRNVDPTLKLYFGEYLDSAGKPKGYYYRCRRDGACDRIEDPWIGGDDKYRVFVMRGQGVISRLSHDHKVTDVATIGDNVLIARGSCWDAKPQRLNGKDRLSRK